MTDKFDEFMKKNVPEASGGLRTLELSPRSNWTTFMMSGILAASIALVVVNRPVEDPFIDDLAVTFDDEFPEEIQVAEMVFDEI